MATSVKLLDTGIMQVDAGSMFGAVPKASWGKEVRVDRRNRMRVGVNCLAIQVNGHNVLVDTGMGVLGDEEDPGGLAFSSLYPPRLRKRLKALNLATRDIDVVILSHLHADHAGGCTRFNRVGQRVSTFPKARYIMQSDAMNEIAHHRNPRTQSLYHEASDMLLLESVGQLELRDVNAEVLPGLYLVKTGGHAPGHQIVMFRHGGETVVYLGDLVPTPYHLSPGVVSAFDTEPEVTLQVKTELLAEAGRKGWLLVFSHGLEVKAGYWEQLGDGHGRLRPVRL